MSNRTKQTQPQNPPPGWFRRCLRFLLRSVRLFLILVLLSVFAGFWYLHEVGLPESVTQRVIAQFKAKGWNVSIGRLRWRGFGLVVGDNIQLSQNEPNSPQLFIQEASCDFHLAGSLKTPRLELESIAVDGGYVSWSLPGTNRHSSIVVCRDLKGLVRSRDDDAWDLSYLNFSALPVWPSGPGGIKMSLRGNLQHASKLSQWKIVGGPKTPSEKTPLDWAKLFNTIHALQFAASPELTVRLQVDAADLASSKAEVKFAATDLRSPWGSGTNLLLTMDLQPAGSWQTNLVLRDAFLHASLHLDAENTVTPWGKAKDLSLQLKTDPTLAGTLGTNTQLEIEAVEPVTPTERAKSLAATVQIAPDPSRTNTYQFQITASANAANTRFGQAQEIALDASPVIHFSTNLSLHDISGPAQITLKQVQSPYAEATQATLLTAWRWPELQISADAQMYNGALLAKTAYNATNGELHFNLSSDIDVQPEVVRLLRSQSNPALTNTIKWIGYYTNLVPPNLELEGRLALPPSVVAGAPATNWFAEALPTLSATGHVNVGAGAFHGAFFLNAETSFTLTNMLVTLSHLKVGRDEGALEVEYQSDLRTGEFHSRIASQIYPNVAQAFLNHPEVRQAVDEVVFTTPPSVQGELKGSWRDLRRLYFQGAASATNFSIHGENVKSAQTQLQFTNLVLNIIDPFAERVEGSGRASLVAIDIPEGLLYLSNGVSRLDPYAITRIVGKEAVKAIAPYQFASPPYGEVNGVVDLKRHSDRNDLHFKVQGGLFHWGKFEFQKVAGQVDWVGKTLCLTNIQGDLKAGRIDGHAYFDFEPEQGPALSCKVNLVDVDLHEFLAAWSPKTNHIEGIFNAELNVTQANAGAAETWQGYGWVSLKNGLLWDIPMFGLFSPVLNTFAPGLGNSRASEGSATYMITNGIISTSDLEIHATAMRMKIQGTVDFDSQANVRAEAELLRDVPVIGLPMSKILWPFTKLFEYKVTGSLDNPKAEPVYVLPRVLLHPIKSLKDFVGEEKKE